MSGSIASASLLNTSFLSPSNLVWTKGKSGNPRGRPKSGTAIADLARRQVDKHKLIDKLASIAAGAKEYSDVDVDQQLRAIQLLLAYGCGPPRAEIGSTEGLRIEVVSETNYFAIASAARDPDSSVAASEALQRPMLRASLGQDDVGDGSPDSSSAGS